MFPVNNIIIAITTAIGGLLSLLLLVGVVYLKRPGLVMTK
jgi:hypothetical protein